VLLVDLDNFKMVNDSYGHACGDAALKQAGRALSSAVRSGDAVVRYGGDEFILLLRDCGAADAVAVATDVQIALAAVRLSGRETPLTASIGIAMFPEHGDTLEDVVFRADQAMYVAKASGRNRISAYSADRETGTAVRAAAAGVFPRSLHSPESSSTTTQQALVAPPADGASSQPTQLRRHLEEERRRLEDLEQWAGVGSFEVDLDTGSVEWSAAMHRLLGSESDRAADEGLPVLPLARIAPEDRQALIAALTEWPDNEAVPAVHELIIHLLDTSDPFEGVDEASAGSAFSDAPAIWRRCFGCRASVWPTGGGS
jgi:diguanylate cyclase (GGDEF)-like protein